MSMQGTHKARAKEWGLGHSSTGKEQVAVLFELTAGEHQGKYITWYGYFTETTVDRTLDSLRHCGWDGDNFVTLEGLGKNEVELVIEPEEYQGKVNDRVKWVNRLSTIALKEKMSGDALATFAAKMRGKALAHKQSYGGPRTQAKPANGPSGQAAGPRDDEWRPPNDDDVPY